MHRYMLQLSGQSLLDTPRYHMDSGPFVSAHTRLTAHTVTHVSAHPLRIRCAHTALDCIATAFGMPWLSTQVLSPLCLPSQARLTCSCPLLVLLLASHNRYRWLPRASTMKHRSCCRKSSHDALATYSEASRYDARRDCGEGLCEIAHVRSAVVALFLLPVGKGHMLERARCAWAEADCV